MLPIAMASTIALEMIRRNGAIIPRTGPSVRAAIFIDALVSAVSPNVIPQ